MLSAQRAGAGVVMSSVYLQKATLSFMRVTWWVLHVETIRCVCRSGSLPLEWRNESATTGGKTPAVNRWRKEERPARSRSSASVDFSHLYKRALMHVQHEGSSGPTKTSEALRQKRFQPTALIQYAGVTNEFSDSELTRRTVSSFIGKAPRSSPAERHRGDFSPRDDYTTFTRVKAKTAGGDHTGRGPGLTFQRCLEWYRTESNVDTDAGADCGCSRRWLWFDVCQKWPDTSGLSPIESVRRQSHTPHHQLHPNWEDQTISLTFPTWTERADVDTFSFSHFLFLCLSSVSPSSLAPSPTRSEWEFPSSWSIITTHLSPPSSLSFCWLCLPAGVVRRMITRAIIQKHWKCCDAAHFVFSPW